MPDGEVYTAPVKDSVYGYIRYNTPSLYHGKEFNGVRFEFKDGKIVKASFGPNGGFVLARPAGKITLYQVIKVMKPEEDRTAKALMCEVCRHRDGKLLVHFMMHLRDDFLQYLKSVNLENLVAHPLIKHK